MNLKTEIEKVLEKFVGSNVAIDAFMAVGGGSINETYKLTTDNDDFFVKKNSASLYPHMFENEATGLGILKEAGEIDIPDVVGNGECCGESFLILKYIQSGVKTKSFWDVFGKQLAALHKHTDEKFGLDHDNYIGSLVQYNNKHDNWNDFFIQERLDKQVRFARNNGEIDKGTVVVFDRFYTKLENIFPAEPPALLHGDLWGGNFMVNQVGLPVIIDPAVYYGHREMDLGMSQLFGGFDKRFYESYNNHYPLERGWEERLDYCNLYPLMVHVNLFGGGYIQSVKSILKKF
ncbi:MAG: fructosamine kinase family protein [Bacteroidota bacterium]